jgi:hypothetical protein
MKAHILMALLLGSAQVISASTYPPPNLNVINNNDLLITFAYYTDINAL